MNYWLAKSEPVKYPWQQLVADKKTFWDGVRNYAARNNLRAMAKGDQVFFYHSNEGMEVVGIAKVVKTANQDPTTDDTNWVVVDLAPVKALKNPVPLSVIKADPLLQQLPLVRIPRLSVMPVTPVEFDRILELSQSSH